MEQPRGEKKLSKGEGGLEQWIPQWLEPGLLEEPGSAPSMHMVAHKHL